MIPSALNPTTTYDVMLSTFFLKNKPGKGSPEMRNITSRIHKDFKNGHSEKLTIQEIMQHLTDGYCAKFGTFKLQDYSLEELSELRELSRIDFEEYTNRDTEIKNAKQLQLVSTNLLVLDIDDDKGSTDPDEVFNKSGAKAMYYTFSHGEISVFLTKQKAYRLIFEIDEAITDKGLLRFVQESLRDTLYKQFPALRPTEYDGKMVGGIDLLGDNFIFGSNKPNYQINEDAKPIEMRKYADERDAENELKEYTTAQTRYQNRKINPISTTDHEVEDMANFLGDTSKLIDFNQWVTIAIGLWNSTNTISEETVLEVLRIIDGNKHEDSFYLGYKRSLSDNGSTATIASFIKLATDNGYKRSYISKYTDNGTYNGSKVIEPAIVTETIKCKDYINVDDVMNLLNDPARRILLVSDTNSGKTYATIHACKKYLENHKDTFVYFAAPTRALASQISNKYDLGDSLQDDKQAYKLVKKAIDNGSRILCGTYDKATQVLYHLPPEYKLNLIVDEAHSEVLSYNFRVQAINKLFNMVDSERVLKFIGLTGTPQEIDLSHYDKRVLIKADKKKIAKELLFVQYNNENLFTSVVTQIIAKEVKQGSKVLCFVNNKKEIEIMRVALKKHCIKATAITADTRNSRTYKSLLDTELMPTDVVLATIAIADGVNILNDTNYTCIIAPRRISAPFFNLSLIKQASNRFRRTYKRLIIPLAINANLDDERLVEKPYNFESRYRWLLAEANRTAEIIRKKFEPCLNFYKPSVAEALAGLFNTFLAKDFDFEKAYRENEKRTLGLKNYDSVLVNRLDKIKERLLTVDERAIRYQASLDQETYFTYFPQSFKAEIIKITGIDNVKNVLISDYLEPADKTVAASLATIINALHELSIIEESEKRAQVSEILSENIFSILQNDYYSKGKIHDDSELWDTLKKALNSDHLITLKTVIGFLNYEQVIKELTRVTKRSQTRELLNHLNAYEELEFFKQSGAAKKRNKTQAILMQLEKAFADAGPISVQERDLRIDEVVTIFKGRKEREAIVKCFNRFFVHPAPKAVKRGGKTIKVSTYALLNMSFIMQHHDLTLSEIEGIYDKLRYNHRLK